MNIANTIFEQLGGNKFAFITGAKRFVGHSDGLGFHLPNRLAADGINYIFIQLTGKDLYNIEFARITTKRKTGGVAYVTVTARHDVYCDGLHETLRDVTGLATRMPRIVGQGATV